MAVSSCTCTDPNCLDLSCVTALGPAKKVGGSNPTVENSIHCHCFSSISEKKEDPIGQYHTKCGPQTSNISVVLEMHVLGLYPRPTKSA